jgi:hypothetical protein
VTTRPETPGHRHSTRRQRAPDNNLSAISTTPLDNNHLHISYVVDGVSYSVASVTGPYLQQDGGEGWDVQVTPTTGTG